MRRFSLLTAVLAAAIIPLGGLLTAAPALAYNVSTVYKDCENNGQLTGHYPRGELQAALNSMPSEVAEYSACSDIIRQALLRASSSAGAQHTTSKNGLLAGGGHHDGGSGPGKGAGHHSGKGGTSAAKNARRVSRSGSAKAVTLAGSDIRPGTTAAASSLPTALLVVLILLALTAVSGGAVAIRRRVVARHST